jgi:glycosyltransferase involved in cell wall biosynthesis
MMDVARDLAYQPVFCGAFRQAGLPATDTWDGHDVVRVGRVFPLLNGTHLILYVKSVILYNLALFYYVRRQRPKLVHASDLETMPGMVLYALLYQARLIYNIHDNLAQRYSVPALISVVLNVLEGICVLMSDQTVVPEAFRRDALPYWCRHKVSVIRNTPKDPGYAAPSQYEDGRIRIFYAGWLDWGRGLGSLIELADSRDDVILRVAGDGAEEIVSLLRSKPNVEFLGFLDHDRIMVETARCHIVPALYDPRRPINRFAAPNKLAEALAVGRPVLINQEILISESLADMACAVITPYVNVANVGDQLKTLVDDPARYTQACMQARNVYDDRYAWEVARARTQSILTGDAA